jgi:predicted nucleic acid-binding protein
MKAVCNTTPLRYLIAIEQEHLLGQLFEKVFVPVAVHEELTEARTPEIVRRRVLSLPALFEVRALEESHTSPFPAELHRGERQAILLTEELRVDMLLIDEQIGRTIALSRNLPLSGTLGVLERADKMGFVSTSAIGASYTGALALTISHAFCSNSKRAGSSSPGL